MPTCNCGCEQETQGGYFVPGHDQTLRATLERRISGGLLRLRDLIDAIEAFAAGRASREALDQQIRLAFPKDGPRS
jgi:hypothetical protein